jgi:hypothetical protein
MICWRLIQYLRFGKLTASPGSYSRAEPQTSGHAVEMDVCRTLVRPLKPATDQDYKYPNSYRGMSVSGGSQILWYRDP